MSRTATILCSIRISSRLALRFAVPPGFHESRWPFDGCAVGLRRDRDVDGAPALSVIHMPRAQVGATLEAALLKQKRQSNANPNRLLRTCRQARVGGFKCGFIEVYDRRDKRHDVTYLRLLGASAVVCGYRCRGSAGRKELDTAARRVLRTVEVAGRHGAAATKPGMTVRKAGFFLRLPEGWERQDVFGQITAFAPGTGFRPRICISLENDRDERNTEPTVDSEVLDAIRVAQRQLCSRARLNPALRCQHAAGHCLTYAWSGTHKHNGARIHGRTVMLSAQRGRALIMYVAQAGVEFKRFEPEFDQAIASIRWTAARREPRS